MKLCNINWTFLVGLIFVGIAESAEYCCAKNTALNYPNCADGKNPLPTCESPFPVLMNMESPLSAFKIRRDSRGEYLDAYELGVIVRSPNFCVADNHHEEVNNKFQTALFCYSSRIPYEQLSDEIDESDNPDYYYMTYWTLFDDFVNLLSCLLLAVAFYVYYLVIQTRQIHDVCLLNVAGSLCLAYAARLYDFFSSRGAIPDLCITKLYVMHFFNLSGFAWYALFMYYVWKQSRSAVSLEHNQFIKQLRFIGYGVPAILIILANIHAHARNFYAHGNFELECYAHEEVVEDMYVNIPIILAIGINCFFWFLLESHTGAAAVKPTLDEFNLKTKSSLLTLNRRLFFTLGLFWLLNIVSNWVINFVISSASIYSWFLLDTVTNTTGVFVALLLVMSRARVWNCVIHKYENIEWLRKWQPSDEEISTHT